MVDQTSQDAGGITRRQATRLMATAAAGLLVSPAAATAQNDQRAKSPMLIRKIPSSDEPLPVIGLGTWQAFDAGDSGTDRQPLEEVLSRFVKLGGRMVDSSPMYGRAERVVGEIAIKLALHPSLFLASKVWTTGKDAGIRSMNQSLDLLQTKKIDLMQVHNLVDAGTHLATLREWKTQGRARYLGITHHNSSAYGDVAQLLAREKMDFVQINYSILEREAEEKILPLARERGVAVIINRPFGGGGLFGRVRGKALPEWAAEFDCTSWAQFFLKWIVAHPAVICAIPATSNPRHLEDNMSGGIGRLPEAKMRPRMVETVAAL